MENEQFSEIMKFIENEILENYIRREMKEYQQLSKKSQLKYNALTVTSIILTSSLPFITLVKNDLLTAGIASVAAILGAISFSFNFKYEWQSHLVSLTYHKGLLKEFELETQKIKIESAPSDKIGHLFQATEIFLKKFNEYEYKEITSYFKQLSELKTDQTSGNKK